ncbi:hypothetical protein NKDENANG_01799 [Candidatus Entotheonellaceae bacterium PAL068K]
MDDRKRLDPQHGRLSATFYQQGIQARHVGIDIHINQGQSGLITEAGELVYKNSQAVFSPVNTRATWTASLGIIPPWSGSAACRSWYMRDHDL